LNLNDTLMIPYLLLFGSSGPEDPKRTQRGGKEEAKRTQRGQKEAIRGESEEKPKKMCHSSHNIRCLSQVSGSAVPICQVFSRRKCCSSQVLEKAVPGFRPVRHIFEKLGWILIYICFISQCKGVFIKCPVLALNGTKDMQVAYEENLEAITEVLRRGGNKKVNTVKCPGLNHLFQTANTVFHM
jgi:hypothetical protein